jgi:hypothetical protein
MIESSGPGRGWEFFSVPPRPARLWPAPPPSLIGNGYQDVKLTTHLHLMPTSRMRGDIPPLPSTSSWRGA